MIKSKRIVYLDVLRVLATFMVIMVHVGDAYILNTETMTFGKEATFFAVFLRASVPLFIIMSSILLLPIKTGNTKFFKRRFSRVVVPFLFWSIIYVFLPLPGEIVFGGPDNVLASSDMNVFLYNLIMIPFNFTGSNVHFWFIYIILGLYLFMPIFSPWLKGVTRKALIFFLGIWGITLFLPHIRMYFPQIHGESDWNAFGMFYYFGGYFGYVLLGYFLHHYNKFSRMKSFSIGVFLFVLGVVLTYWGFIHDQNAFLNKITTSGVEDWKLIEFNMNFLSPNVVIMTIGMFMMIQKIVISDFLQRFFKELSLFSYSIFLVHYIICLWIAASFKNMLQINAGLEQLLFAIITFSLSYALVKLISFIPKSKYIIG